MKIVFATLHVRRSAQAVPLAAGCLAAALPPGLRSQAVLVDLFPDQDGPEMLRRIEGAVPDLVALPLYSWNRSALLALTRQLRRNQPRLILVAGGPEACADPEGVLREGDLDAVVRGEGEESMAELAELFSHSRTFDAPPGVTLRRDDAILAGEPRPPCADLDRLPSPWLDGPLRPQPSGGVLWETSRGCPFACDFCYDARGARGVRHIGRERLEAELELFVRCEAAQVWVLDSTFNYPPERGRQLLELIARRAPHLHFHLEAKAEFLDRPTARLLGRLNCSVQVGLQSADPRVLKNIHRNLDPQLFTERLHLLASEGVTYGIDLIYGLPGDSHEGFRRSLNTAMRLAPNHIDIFPLAVLPGTVLHRHRERFGIRAAQHPPYELLESGTYPAADMARSRQLAAAADLFYNIGRAVGFFDTLCRACRLEPAALLEHFATWALGQGDIGEARLLKGSEWSIDQVLAAQDAFIIDLLGQQGRGALIPAARDLLHYHFHYAECLLGDEAVPPDPELLEGLDLWRTPLVQAPGMRLVPFRYEILDLLEMGEVDLERCAELFRPVGSTAIFQRRDNEVLCESLEEDFLLLLRGCDGTRAPREIFAGSLAPEEAQEIVAFAVAEGFLLPANNNLR